MAHKLILPVPLRGMPFLWNIDAKVGTQVTEPNVNDDVALVQLLIRIAISKGGGIGATSAPGCKAPPSVTGNMDHITGFWIYFGQVEAKQPADGNLTPSTKSPSEQRLIVRLNLGLFIRFRQDWENLPNNLDCPPFLKAQLLGSTK